MSASTSSLYHEVHYAMFHMVLPSFVLRMPGAASLRGAIAPEFLQQMWSQIAGTMVESPAAVPKTLRLAESAFGVAPIALSDGWDALMITCPRTKGPLEAAFVAIVSNTRGPKVRRYFTCEAPAMDGAPYFVGESLFRDVNASMPSRANHGPIEEPSAESLLAFVVTRLKIPVDREAVTRSVGRRRRTKGRSGASHGGPFPKSSNSGFPVADHATPSPEVGPSTGPTARPTHVTHAGRTVRAIPDVDELLAGEAGGSESITPTVSGERAVGGRLSVSGPIDFDCRWNSNAREIASCSLTNLYRLATSGGKAMVLSAAKAKGLGRRTSSYVQFMWEPGDVLLTEVQGDYSYWGLSVPSRHWPRLERAGLSIPSGEIGNFRLRIPGTASHEQRLETLADVFDAFKEVLEPVGRIQVKHF
jgi:hypothetical protein